MAMNRETVSRYGSLLQIPVKIALAEPVQFTQAADELFNLSR